MRHLVHGVTAALHEAAKRLVVVAAGAAVDHQRRADVRMHNESRQGAKNEIEIVGPVLAAALGMGDRHDAVDIRIRIVDGLEAGCHGLGKSGGIRRGGENDDEVSGADPTVSRPAIAGEGRGHLRLRNLRTGLEGPGIERVGLHVVAEVGLGRQREVDAALGENLENLLVAHVLAGRQVAGGAAERQAPREQRRAGGNGLEHEAVSLENGVRQGPAAPLVDDDGTRLEAAGGDGDVVAGRRNAADVVEIPGPGLCSHVAGYYHRRAPRSTTLFSRW